MTAPSLVSSLAVLISISAMPYAAFRAWLLIERATDLKVSNKLFHDCIPGNEALDENIGRPEVLGRNILLDERLSTRKGGSVLACARDRGGARWRHRVGHDWGKRTGETDFYYTDVTTKHQTTEHGAVTQSHRSSFQA